MANRERHQLLSQLHDLTSRIRKSKMPDTADDIDARAEKADVSELKHLICTATGMLADLSEVGINTDE